MVERPDHDVHRLSHQCVRERAQFPIAEVRGGNQNATAAFLRLEIVLKSLVTDPFGNVFPIDSREPREGIDQPRDGSENLVDNRLALLRGFLGVRHFEIAARGPAQAWQNNIEKLRVEQSEAKRELRHRPENETRDQVLDERYSIHPPPNTRSPS